MLAILISMLLIPFTSVSQDSEPINLSNAPGLAAGGNFARTPDGLLHFVWNECTAPEEDQCGEPTPDEKLILRHRSLDPSTGEWSATTTIREKNHNLINPRLYVHGDTLHLVWLQGWVRHSVDPVHLWHCVLASDFTCTEAARVGPDTGRALYQAGAVGPDGHLRVAWQEEDPNAAHARLLYRELTPTGWGSLVEFTSGSKYQRNAAITVDADNVAHVAWREHPGHAGSGERILHATVSPGAAQASPVRDLSGSYVERGKVALTIHGDTVHAVFSNTTDLYHRALEPGAEEWSPPVNVSRDPYGKGVMDPFLTARPNGDLIAGWVNVTREGWNLWIAKQVDGFWHRPHKVEDSPYTFLRPFALADEDGTAHLAWSGVANEIEFNQMHYLALGADREIHRPPEIDEVKPQAGGWTRGAPVQLEAGLLLDAPLDGHNTTWTLDGESLGFQTTSTGIRSAAVDLEEGEHETNLHVQDVLGESTERIWTFQVDQTPPGFTIFVEDDSGGANLTGWQSEQVWVRAEVHDGEGAPASMQFKAAPDQPWEDMNPSFDLPEGFLYTLSFRAVDKAGNQAQPETIKIGWDGEPPDAKLDSPTRWMRSPDVRVSFADVAEPEMEGAGSPEWIELGLYPVEGNESEPIGEIRSRLDDGEAVLTDVPDGDYEMRAGVSDDAGNVQDPAPGPWRVGVDTSYPDLVIQEVEDEGVRVQAADEGSGLVRMVLQDTAGAPVQEWSLDGDVEMEVALTPEDLGGVESAWLEDAAGNAVIARSGLGGWTVEEVSQPEPGAEKDTGEARQGNGALGGDEHTEAPVPGGLIGVLFLSLALLIGRRRSRLTRTQNRKDRSHREERR